MPTVAARIMTGASVTPAKIRIPASHAHAIVANSFRDWIFFIGINSNGQVNNEELKDDSL